MDILNIYTNVYITFFEVQLYNFVPMLPIFLGCIIRLMEIYFQYISETKKKDLCLLSTGKPKREIEKRYIIQLHKNLTYIIPRDDLLVI